MIGGALMASMPTATMRMTAPSSSSSRAASAPNLIRSRAEARATATGARRACGITVTSPICRRQNQNRASPPGAVASSALFSPVDLDLDLDAALSTHATALGDLAEGLEEPVQALYLVFLLGFLVVGAYLVVRQVRE